MQRKNRLAVFEHVHQKERTKSVGTRVVKRAKSPDNAFEDNNVSNRPKLLIS